MKHIPLILSLCVATPLLGADAPAGKVSYYKEILPIFRQHCQGCHQPAKPLGGYVMTSYADLLKKGDSEKNGIVPNKPQESFLVQLLGEVKGRARMPKNQPPLPDAQIKLIEKWIAEGAVDDTPASAKAPPVDPDNPPIYKSLPVVNAVAYSPKGEYLAISGYHEILLWAGDGSKRIARLVGLSERIQSLAFSPDGTLLAASGGDPGRSGEIQIWNVEKRSLKISIPVSFDVVAGISWSPDGTLVACGCADNTVRAFEVKTGKQVLFQGAHSDWVTDTVFSQDGKHLVSVSRDRSVKLTEVATNRFIDNVTSITPGALKGGLNTVTLRPPPKLLTQNEKHALLAATVLAPRVNLLTVWENSRPPAPRRAKVPRDTPGVAPNVYDEILTAGADGTPRLYKMHREEKRVIGDDANRIREYEKMTGRIYSLAFSPKGDLFAAGSSLDGKGEVCIYETDKSPKKVILKDLTTPIYDVAFHPRGNKVASGGFDGMIRIHDAYTGELIKEFIPVPLQRK